MRDEDVLGAFREDPLPPSGVDVGRAVRTGRRQRRVRAAGVAGALALVLAGGAAVPAWFAGGGVPQVGASPEATLGPPPPPCPSPSPATPPAVTKNGTAPAAFDIMRRWIDLDRLEKSRGDAGSGKSATDFMHLRDYTTARYWQRITLVTEGDGVPADLAQLQVQIMVFARDGKPVFGPPGGFPAPVDVNQGEPAEPIGGRPARWLPGRQGMYQWDAARLGWQWADGAWAFVAVADGAQRDEREPSAAAMAALRETAWRVADLLTIRAGKAVTMPFTVPGVPECSRLTSTNIYRDANIIVDGKPFVRAGLVFGRADNTDPLRFPPDVNTTVTADSIATPDDKPGSVNEQVDGHPAVVDDGYVEVYGVAGYALEISSPLREDALVAYARTVRIVDGAHGDESKWTDRPIRR